MERHELEQWLCGPDSTPPSPAAIAEALGLPFDALADTTLLRTLARVRSLRFTLAVLHDVFAADRDVCRWLETPRNELGGVSARTALVAGRAALVEGLAVRAWNESVCMAGAA